MQTYKTRHVEEIFSISDSTVRQYAERFSGYLSAGATPESGSHRVFNQDDLNIFATVMVLKEQGLSWDEIKSSLDNGTLYEAPEIDDNSLALATSSFGGDVLAKFEALEKKIEAIERKQLLSDVQQVQDLKQELKDKDNEIKNLYMQLGMYKAMLRMKRKDD